MKAETSEKMNENDITANKEEEAIGSAVDSITITDYGSKIKDWQKIEPNNQHKRKYFSETIRSFI